jgi:hypothetical protein
MCFAMSSSSQHQGHALVPDSLAWSTAFSAYEQFEQTFSPLKECAESATKKRNYRTEAYRKLSLVGL